jgi:Card1-like, endonuclease domain
MLRPRVHVSLLYNTATANVTPALDPDFRPEEVVLVYGPRQKHRANCLESVLNTAGVKVSRWQLTHIFDSEHVRDRMLQLLSTREEDDLALNASGGTRPMVVGAYEVFRELDKPIFYVHPETDFVTWLHRKDLPAYNCADRIKLPAFLRAHGATQVETAAAQGIPKNLRRLTDQLIETSESMSRALAALNWFAQNAENTDFISPELEARQLVWKELHWILNRFASEGLLKLSGHRVQFRDESARFYANGGWLEQHVFGLLFGLRKEIPEIQDLGRGIKFVRKSNGKSVKNELDVAFLANNRCYIIECKTKRLTMQGTDRFEQDSPGAEALYKLDTLKWLVGENRTRAMLVSYRDLPRWDRDRAHELGIATCAGQQLTSLESLLRRWIKSAGRPF